MRKLLLLTITAFFTVNVWGQTVDINYLNPTYIFSDYKYLRFGNITEYYAGFMYNIQHAAYGDGNDFTLFTYDNRDLVLRSGTGNIVLHPDNMGNVGIGTTSPNAKLEVVGNGGITSFIGNTNLGLLVGGSNNAGTDYSGIDFTGYSGSYNKNPLARIATKLTPSGSYLQFGTSNSYVTGITNTAMSIDYNGNVGIGITSPNAKLDVTGTIKSDNSITGSILYAGETSNINGFFASYGQNDILFNRTSGPSYIKQLGGKPLIFVTGEVGDLTPTITISNNKSTTFYGSVRIGTSAIPSGYRLAIDGKIICEEVRVDMSDNWADFVFEDDYNLMPLQELDDYIQENKHLPEIPTTKEVKENGISVGEMNAKLLQKIEELTLYVIELKKENEEQSQMNKQLINRIEKLENLSADRQDK